MMNSIKTLNQRRSPLLETQTMSGHGSKKVGVKELAQALPLTSLIDAFSIIVIYLLIGTQSGLETPVPNLKLPVAQNSETVEKEVAILKFEKGRMFLNDQPVTLQSLETKLVELKKASAEKAVELMVQADQEMKYSDLDPLIKAGSLAGIEKLKFAVLPIQ